MQIKQYVIAREIIVSRAEMCSLNNSNAGVAKKINMNGLPASMHAYVE